MLKAAALAESSQQGLARTVLHTGEAVTARLKLQCWLHVADDINELALARIASPAKQTYLVLGRLVKVHDAPALYCSVHKEESILVSIHLLQQSLHVLLVLCLHANINIAVS